MGIDWKKFSLSFAFFYAIIYVAFKVFTLAFFPEFYFGPFHALSVMIMLVLGMSVIEVFRGLPNKVDDQILANAALMLIASIVANGNSMEVPNYIVVATAKKLNENKIVLNIEEKDDKYVMKVDVK